MPKYKIIIKKRYEIEVEARKIEEARKAGWEKHQKMLSEGEDFPVSLKIDHERVREQIVTMTSNQRKKLERKLREINEQEAEKEKNAEKSDERTSGVEQTGG